MWQWCGGIAGAGQVSLRWETGKPTDKLTVGVGRHRDESMAQAVLGACMGKRDLQQPQPERVAPWGE